MVPGSGRHPTAGGQPRRRVATASAGAGSSGGVASAERIVSACAVRVTAIDPGAALLGLSPQHSRTIDGSWSRLQADIPIRVSGAHQDGPGKLTASLAGSWAPVRQPRRRRAGPGPGAHPAQAAICSSPSRRCRRSGWFGLAWTCGYRPRCWRPEPPHCRHVPTGCPAPRAWPPAGSPPASVTRAHDRVTRTATGVGAGAVGVQYRQTAGGLVDEAVRACRLSRKVGDFGGGVPHRPSVARLGRVWSVYGGTQNGGGPRIWAESRSALRNSGRGVPVHGRSRTGGPAVAAQDVAAVRFMYRDQRPELPARLALVCQRVPTACSTLGDRSGSGRHRDCGPRVAQPQPRRRAGGSWVVRTVVWSGTAMQMPPRGEISDEDRR